MLTADKNIEYQQNPEKLTIPVVVLYAATTRLPDISVLTPEAIELLKTELVASIYNIR